MMNKKIFAKIIEFAWIAMGVFCLIMGFYYTSKIGAQNAWLIFAMAAISIGMFFVRRMQRKNLEKKNNRKNSF
jgi:uncharacterized membrane protein